MKSLISTIVLTLMLCALLISCTDKGGSENGKGDEQIGNNTSSEIESPEDDDIIISGDQNSESSVTEDPDKSDDLTDDDTTAEENGGQTDVEEQPKDQYVVGYNVGNLAPSRNIEAAKGGTVNIEDYRGKVVVINLWGEWCYWCKVELPDFSRVAEEYEDVVVVAIHSNYQRASSPSYISNNFADSEIIFAYDNQSEDYYYSLGGTGSYPRTLVLDANGVITYNKAGAISYDYLVGLVKSAGAVK